MKDDNQKSWDNAVTHWDFFGSPGRPSKNDIEIYKSIIEKTSPKKVLVLGSTPEIRDLLQDFGCKVYCIDINKYMLYGMRKYMHSTNFDDETLVNDDWLNMPFEDKSFDLVIGDLAIANLEYKNQEDFLKEINHVLKDDCRFITKIFFYDLDFPVGNIMDEMEKFSVFEYERNKVSELFTYLNHATYDLGNRRFCAEYVDAAMQRYLKEKKATKGYDKVSRLIESNYIFWGKPIKHVWDAYTKEDTFKRISKHFRIVSEHIADDYMFAKYYPTIVCEKI